jgi:large subunit ribosomal protein L21
MYAIIQSGSGQYKVSEGDSVRMQRIAGLAAGAQVEFDKVILLGGDGQTRVGTPFVQGAKVIGEVVREVKGEKLIHVKFRRRKASHVKKGHRQRYMDVKIKKIIAAQA